MFGVVLYIVIILILIGVFVETVGYENFILNLNYW